MTSGFIGSSDPRSTDERPPIIYIYNFIELYTYIYIYRNGLTTQAGAAVAQALMMAAPCGI